MECPSPTLKVETHQAEQDVILANHGQNKLSGRSSKEKPQNTCRKCGKQGHYSDNCEEEQQSSATMLMLIMPNGEFDGKEYFQFLQHL